MNVRWSLPQMDMLGLQSWVRPSLDWDVSQTLSILRERERLNKNENNRQKIRRYSLRGQGTLWELSVPLENLIRSHHQPLNPLSIIRSYFASILFSSLYFYFFFFIICLFNDWVPPLSSSCCHLNYFYSELFFFFLIKGLFYSELFWWKFCNLVWRLLISFFFVV